MYRNLRQWLFLIVGILLLGLASRTVGMHEANRLWAAPDQARLGQTVPIPTATPLNTAVPTATPDSDEPSDDEPTSEDPSDEEPTATPTPDETERLPEDDEEIADDEANDDDGSTGDSTTGDSTTGDSTTEGTGGEESSGEASSPETPANEGDGSDSGDAVEYQTAKVDPIVLNVRSGPGTENAVVGTVFQGDPVQVLGRTGAWWQVCCALGSTEPGWVDSQFLEPDFDIDDLEALVPAIGESADNGESAAERNGAGQSASAANDSVLDFLISHDPVFVWQGQQVQMTFTVTNTSSASAENVRIRNEFPAETTFIEVADAGESDAGEEAKGGVIKVEESDNGRAILVATWPELDGGDSLSITVVLEIKDDIEAGVIIDNLAVVNASNADSVTAGISIGMPPLSLPVFR